MMPCRLKRAQQPVLCFVCCQTPGRFLLANWTRILWETAQNAVSSSNNGDSVPAAIATVYLSIPIKSGGRCGLGGPYCQLQIREVTSVCKKILTPTVWLTGLLRYDWLLRRRDASG